LALGRGAECRSVKDTGVNFRFEISRRDPRQHVDGIDMPCKKCVILRSTLSILSIGIGPELKDKSGGIGVT
jgi:hypothetical protein